RLPKKRLSINSLRTIYASGHGSCAQFLELLNMRHSRESEGNSHVLISQIINPWRGRKKSTCYRGCYLVVDSAELYGSLRSLRKKRSISYASTSKWRNK